MEKDRQAKKAKRRNEQRTHLKEVHFIKSPKADVPSDEQNVATQNSIFNRMAPYPRVHPAAPRSPSAPRPTGSPSGCWRSGPSTGSGRSALGSSIMMSIRFALAGRSARLVSREGAKTQRTRILLALSSRSSRLCVNPSPSCLAREGAKGAKKLDSGSPACAGAGKSGMTGGSGEGAGLALIGRPQPPLRNLGHVLRLLLEPGNPRWRQRMADDIGFGLRLP
jgi:hypothetical protein